MAVPTATSSRVNERKGLLSPFDRNNLDDSYRTSVKTTRMDLPLALHTDARTFCANQHSRWSGEYMPIVDSGKDRIGMEYSKAAYGLFPRFRLDEAIEVEVERTTGQQFRSLEEVRKVLLESGSRAWSSLLQEFQRSPEACVALTEEWKAFEAYISSLDDLQLVRIEPLPYRRGPRTI